MTPSTRGERLRLAILFFLHAGALGMWNMASSNVLKTHGLERIVPYVFAATALAAMISPLMLGALADQRVPATRLVRWLALCTSGCLALSSFAIERGFPALAVLALLQLTALCFAPMWGLTTSVVLARLCTPQREFGPVRVWATIGWMAAGGVTSFLLVADASTRSGFVASALWLAVAAYTLTLPSAPPSAGLRQWHSERRDVLGLSALRLLKHRDHRVVFVSIAVFSMPFAAFFPFGALHLGDLGVKQISAALSAGQITEVIAMYGLSSILTRVRLKWVFLAGIGFGILRFALFAQNTRGWVFAGIILHGLCFTLFFITAQIYLEQRVPLEMRVRAQSLMTMMSAGIGTLTGSIGSGWWRAACRHGAVTDWPRFWWGLCAATGAVFVFFAVAYRGKGASPGSGMLTRT